MAISCRSSFGLLAAATVLLWPALWNGYPIVFADTGTYLSQAIHRYAGWDRPVFYSLFMLPLHATLTVWPVVIAQALLAVWVLRLVVRVLVPEVSFLTFAGGIGMLAVLTWLPWLVSELMPDLFTPLLVLVLCLLIWVPDRLSPWERYALTGLAAFMIASQQSSVPLACLLGVILLACNRARSITGRGAVNEATVRASEDFGGSANQSAFPPFGGTRSVMRDKDAGAPSPPRSWLVVILAPALAVLGLCTVNLTAHGRFAISPFGNVFLLARVIYDGPGMMVLRRDCPGAHWRMCSFLDSLPANSDEFLWTPDSPLYRAGGPKAVSEEAGTIIRTALRADPAGEARAALANTLEQMTHFDSGDGLNSWPIQVTPWIERDFPHREQAAYRSARQQTNTLSVPKLLSQVHVAVAVLGVLGCATLLPIALKRRAACAGFLLAVLVGLPASAAITGSLSAPHDRYQARIMWLAPFVAVVSFTSLQPATAFKSVKLAYRIKKSFS